MKTCSKCQAEKEESEFALRAASVDGRQPRCRCCVSDYDKSRQPSIAESNRERCSKWYQENSENVLLEQAKKYRDNPEPRRQAVRARYRKNPAEINRKNDEYTKKRRLVDLDFRLRCNLRSRLVSALKGVGEKKGSTMSLLGCSVLCLRNHLELHFKPGMTWENYGLVWQIDHIKPCAKFDLTDSEQQQDCFHWSNLQPLFALENRKKSDKYAPPEHKAGLVV